MGEIDEQPTHRDGRHRKVVNSERLHHQTGGAVQPVKRLAHQLLDSVRHTLGWRVYGLHVMPAFQVSEQVVTLGVAVTSQDGDEGLQRAESRE